LYHLNNYSMIFNNFNSVLKKTLLFSMIFFSVTTLKAQLTGTKTIPGDYASVAAFVTDVNTLGVGAGGVTLNIPAGYTETAPSLGYQLTATGTSANPIIIQKSGAGLNPLITSYTGGTGTPGSAIQDGIFALIGSDYVTIDGIDLVENAANTTNPSTMEYGYGLFKANATNGCQNNVIKNCVITLSNNNNAAGTAPAFDGSRGINVVNSLVTTQTTSITITAASGSNSNNSFTGNTIKNVNIGIALSGFAATAGVGPTPTAATFFGDLNNIIGGSLANANTIQNFGGAAAAANPAAGIRTVNQWSPIISFNTLNNNIGTGGGANHASTLRAILIGAATSANTDVTNNNITLVSGALTSQLDGISNAAGSTTLTNTININNNIIQLAYPTATTAVINGIINSGTPTTVNINANTITNVSTLPLITNVLGGTGTMLMIEGGSPTNLNINNNSITGLARTGASGSWRVIKITSPTNATISGNTIENLAYSLSTSTGSIDGIYSLSSAVNVTISNNIVRNLSTPTTGTINGIREFGIAGNKIITGNQVYSFATTTGGAGGATFNGIYTSTGTVTIQNNTIYNLVSTGSTGGTGGAINGIQLSGSTATSILANKIYDLASNSTNPVVSGVLLTGGTTTTLTNNIIGDLRASNASATNAVIGINITGSTTALVYYNTVRINANSIGTNFGTSAISASTTPNLTLNNNIFVNNSTSNGTGLSVAYRRSSTTLTSYQTSSNRNDFFAPVIYNDGTTSYSTLATYQTAMATRDANSISENPNFASTTGSNANFLHINTALPTLIESGGANIAGITTDFDANTRQGNAGYVGTGTAPDMGADEFELAVVNCSAANGGTISPSTNTVCQGSTKTITPTGFSNDFGNTYQWKVSTIAGGPYVNVTGGSGATTSSYTTGVLTPGTYYYVMETTCSFGSLTGISNEYTLVVNPTPTVAVSPSSATYCSPGTAVSLTASGASTYAWSPSTGLSAIVGTTVNASPAATTTYSVIGTALGCASLPTTVVLTVNNAPVISSVSATPSSFCSIGNSQLNAVASINDNYSVSSIPYSLVPTPGTGVTTLANTGVATTTLTSGTLDDGGWNNQTIPFTFNFYGTNYTSFSVSTNGFIYLGATAPSFTGYGVAFPSTSASSPSIGATYSDLDFRTIGTINYFVTGTAPNRQLVINWSGGNFYNALGAITTQLIIYETTNIIEVHTTNSSGTNTAVLGIQNSGATKFTTAPGRNNVTWAVSTPDAYRFTPPVINYSWSPSTFLSSTTINNPLATNINATTTYTVSATYNGCTTTANTTITANPLPSAPTATNSAQCGGQIPTASVASTTGLPTPTFVWYDAAVGGTALQTSTSSTYTSVIGTTTTLYVAEKNMTTGCESTLTPVTITVASADLVQASVNNATICIGETVNLSVVNINSTPLQSYTYTWSSTAGNGLNATTGAAVTATPTTAGSYVYTVNGIDGGCSAVSTVNVTVNPFIASLSAVNVTCNGAANGTFTLSSSSCGTAPYTYSINGGAFGPIPTNLTPGTYAVVTKDANGFTVAPQSITITEPSAITVPTGISNATVCQNASSAQLTVPTTATITVPVNLGLAAQPAVIGTGTVPTTVAGNPNIIATASLPALPTGATITSVTFTMNGLTPTGGSWGADVFFGFSGAYSVNYSSGTGAPSSTTAFNYTKVFTGGTYNPAGGTVELNYYDQYDDNVGAECTFPIGSSVGTLTIVYTVNNPTVNWYSAATGGSLLGTGAPFETVGTSVLPTTATPGTYTFYAEGTNGTCVSATRTPVTVTVNAAPATNAGSDQTVCSGTAITLTGSGANTYSWNNGVTNAVAFTPVSTTTYTLTGTGANGCISTDQVLVTVNTTPTVNAGVDQTVCSGTAVTLSGSGANTYSWNNSVINGTAFTPAATATYTVTGTAANGCTATDQAIVTVNALPAVNAGIDQTVCANTAVTLSGAGATAYTWNNSITNATAFTPASTATYTVTGTDANGCQNTDQVTVNVNALPTVNAGADQTVCANTAVTLSGSGATSYTWDNSVTNATAFTPASTATYTVTGTDANGCQNTDQVTVTVNALPTVNAGADQTVCANTAVTLSGAGATTYSWDNSVTNTTAFTPVSTATYTVTGTDANGCQNTDQVTVTVNTLPTVNAGADQTVCANTAVTLSGAGATTYSWDNSVTNATAFTPASTATYTVTGTDANGCQNTDQVTVTVNALPTVNAGADQTVCSGTSVTLAGSGANTYTWDNGITDAGAFTATATTTYTVTGTDANGCQNTDQAIVTVNSLPTVNAGADQSVCAGTAVTLAGSGATTYTWDNGVVDAVAFTPANTATYTVTGTGANGCENTDQVVVTVNSIPVATATDNGDATITASSAATYQWIDCATGTAIAGATSQTFTVTANGTYAVIESNGSCSDTSACVTIDYMKLSEMSVDAIGIYPNPTRDNVTVTMTNANASIEVIDAQGKLLKATQVVNGDKIDLSSYETGMYIFRVTTENGTSIFRVSKN
jgi:hypothetical protein